MTIRLAREPYFEGRGKHGTKALKGERQALGEQLFGKECFRLGPRTAPRLEPQQQCEL